MGWIVKGAGRSVRRWNHGQFRGFHAADPTRTRGTSTADRRGRPRVRPTPRQPERTGSDRRRGQAGITGVPIRDPRPRRPSIIADRRTLASGSGIRPEVIESLFRVILWASRDRQASLKAAVPEHVEPRTIAIIGGHGGMGRCFEHLFNLLGHEVLVADIDTERTGQEIAAEADVVMIAVNIESTLEVIKQIGPACREDALLLDITSIKQEPVEAMLRCTNCSVIGTHPLFGPTLHSLQGQRIVLTPARTGRPGGLVGLAAHDAEGLPG